MIRSSSISDTASNAWPKYGGQFAARLCLALVAAAPANAASVPTASEVLDHIGRQVQQFWTNFSSVTCTETVTQSKLGEKDKVLSVQRQTFD